LTALARGARNRAGRDEETGLGRTKKHPLSTGKRDVTIANGNTAMPTPLLATPPDTHKEHQAATAKWSGPGSGHSAMSSRLKSAPQCSELDPRNPSGPAVSRPHEQAGYMTAPDRLSTPHVTRE
jgi:hypothetical protein